jgi:hypothetical protein
VEFGHRHLELLLGPPDTRLPNPEELACGQGVEELVRCGQGLLEPGIYKGSFCCILSGPSRPQLRPAAKPGKEIDAGRKAGADAAVAAVPAGNLARYRIKSGGTFRVKLVG